MHNDSIFAPGPPQEMISIPGKSMKRRSCLTHEHNRLDHSNLGFFPVCISICIFSPNKAAGGQTDIDVAVVAAEIEKKDNVGCIYIWVCILRWSNKKISFMYSHIHHRCNSPKLCGNCIPLPLKPRLHGEPSAFYLSSPAATEPVAPPTLYLLISLSIYL